ncbi:hypothetical protein O3P69_015124 [Scylla paramamosain]|uniref:C3H1-type domain-containing protein n=1 Tax=Scylla paramamosain TaxID=85552 RepID=A0AAW0T3G0_SCYPA
MCCLYSALILEQTTAGVMGHRKNYGRNYFLTQSIQSHRNMSNGLGASPPSPSLRPLSHSSPVRQSSTRAPRRSLWGNGGNNCSRNEERPTVCGRNKHYKWPGNFGNSMKSLNCLSFSSNGVKSISSDSGSISSPNEGSCKDSSIGSSKKVSTPRLSNPLRYKTELCRSFEESGDCRFGEACTFAHGLRELRAVLRHPRYKTDLCRTYHGAGYCQYGARCHFVHDPEEATGVAALRGYKLRSQLGGLEEEIFGGLVKHPPKPRQLLEIPWRDYACHVSVFGSPSENIFTWKIFVLKMVCLDDCKHHISDTIKDSDEGVSHLSDVIKVTNPRVTIRSQLQITKKGEWP